jgi:RNA polymerase sigma factor (sigma-70 family)
MSSHVAILNGDVEADDLEERFQLFVASHREQAVRMAWRLVGGDAAAAEDVVQEAFLNAFKALPGFRGEASLQTWFYRILVRRAANYRRWKGLRTLWNAPFDVDLADPQPAADGDPGLRKRITGALDALTQRQREAFVLVHLEGLTVHEAAALAGSPVGTLKSHLHRALTKLRDELGDLRAEDPTFPGSPAAEKKP